VDTNRTVDGPDHRYVDIEKVLEEAFALHVQLVPVGRLIHVFPDVVHRVLAEHVAGTAQDDDSILGISSDVGEQTGNSRCTRSDHTRGPASVWKITSSTPFGVRESLASR
jgi:hypothetical protein